MKTPPTMLSVEEALTTILGLRDPLPSEEVEISQALGRGLAAEVIAERTLPPWDNSAMDGYAVRAEDLRSTPVGLRVVARVFAGDSPSRVIQRGECARIMTGAPLPQGTDAVVMQEKTAPGPTEDAVNMLEPVETGTNVRRRGEDTRQGEALMPKGASLGIAEAGLLWAQGMTRVAVPRRPTVAIVSTGDELVPVGHPPGTRIVDTNSPSLAAAVAQAGGVPTLLGIAGDTPESLEYLLAGALEHDVVLTSAGASVGEKDFARQVLTSLGAQIHFWKVAMKPGKPLAVATLGRTSFFCLPGNPTSSLVSFELFVRPFLRHLLGHGQVSPPLVGGRTAVSLRKAAGLTHFVRVQCTFESGQLMARPLRTQSSGALRSSASATHLMRVDASTTQLAEGDPVTLLPVSWVG